MLCGIRENKKKQTSHHDGSTWRGKHVVIDANLRVLLLPFRFECLHVVGFSVFRPTARTMLAVRRHTRFGTYWLASFRGSSSTSQQLVDKEKENTREQKASKIHVAFNGFFFLFFAWRAGQENKRREATMQ